MHYSTTERHIQLKLQSMGELNSRAQPPLTSVHIFLYLSKLQVLDARLFFNVQVTFLPAPDGADIVPINMVVRITHVNNFMLNNFGVRRDERVVKGRSIGIGIGVIIWEVLASTACEQPQSGDHWTRNRGTLTSSLGRGGKLSKKNKPKSTTLNTRK